MYRLHISESSGYLIVDLFCKRERRDVIPPHDDENALLDCLSNNFLLQHVMQVVIPDIKYDCCETKPVVIPAWFP
jgi:hypothetical protein